MLYEAGLAPASVAAIEKLPPHVVLMDLNMPRMNGLEATRQIASRWPGARVVGPSVQQNEATRDSMRSAGAVAFVSKSDDPDILVETIRKASRVSGSTWID